MQIIPAIDLASGRSRIVSWPGAATGTGSPTDRPELIVERFVALGARLVHLVDLDGARAGSPANLEAVGRIAARVAIPIQLAGGLEGADHIRLAFAAGATRAIVSAAIVDEPAALDECRAVAGDWLAIGVDARPERLRAFPWQRGAPHSIEELIGWIAAGGVRRVVLTHAGDETARLVGVARAADLEVLVAGGVRDIPGILRLRDAGADGALIGEALLSGAIELPVAMEAAA